MNEYDHIYFVSHPQTDCRQICGDKRGNAFYGCLGKKLVAGHQRPSYGYIDRRQQGSFSQNTFPSTLFEYIMS